jgi:hypothetical protein
LRYARKKITGLLIEYLDKIEKEDDPDYYVTNAESGKLKFILCLPTNISIRNWRRILARIHNWQQRHRYR